MLSQLALRVTIQCPIPGHVEFHAPILPRIKTDGAMNRTFRTNDAKRGKHLILICMLSVFTFREGDDTGFRPAKVCSLDHISMTIVCI